MKREISVIALFVCISCCWGQSFDSNMATEVPSLAKAATIEGLDTLTSPNPQSYVFDRGRTGELSGRASIVKKITSVSLPALALTIPYTQANKYVRDARNEALPSFHNRYDDYLQFFPLGVQLGMYACGVEGYSKKTSELLLSDGLASSIMMLGVTATTTLTRVLRPDGSSHNSFPSGHTAMAFTSATLLHLEYGERYPWLSLGGYVVATSVGVGRILNNRHWIGDVMVGASVGIASAELGYWLSGLIHKRCYLSSAEHIYFSDTDLRISLPWSRGLGLGFQGESVSTGWGLRWLYGAKGYYAFADVMLEGQMFEKSGADDVIVHNWLGRIGWGKSFSLTRMPSFSFDAGVGIGLGRGECFPLVRLSPRLALSRRLSCRIDVAYEYRSKESIVSLVAEGFRYKAPQWRIGSALEIRL